MVTVSSLPEVWKFAYISYLIFPTRKNIYENVSPFFAKRDDFGNNRLPEVSANALRSNFTIEILNLISYLYNKR